MRRVDKITNYESIMFSQADGKELLFSMDNVLENGTCDVEGREFEYYLFNDYVLIVRQTQQKTLFEIREANTELVNKNILFKKEESESEEESMELTSINELEPVEFLEIEYEEEVVLAVKTASGKLYAPDSLENTTLVNEVKINEELNPQVRKVDVAGFRISKTIDCNIFREDKFEFLSNTVELSENFFYKMYKNENSCIVKTNDNKLYKIELCEFEYVTIIIYKEVNEVPDNYTIKFEKYISEKKTNGITNNIKSPFDFFNY